MLEHVRARSLIGARLQDLIQPTWTLLAGGCHPNRNTEGTVEIAGFRIEEEGRRSRGTMRRFHAVPAQYAELLGAEGLAPLRLALLDLEGLGFAHHRRLLVDLPKRRWGRSAGPATRGPS